MAEGYIDSWAQKLLNTDGFQYKYKIFILFFPLGQNPWCLTNIEQLYLLMMFWKQDILKMNFHKIPWGLYISFSLWTVLTIMQETPCSQASDTYC